jgi:protein SCO1/2
MRKTMPKHGLAHLLLPLLTLAGVSIGVPTAVLAQPATPAPPPDRLSTVPAKMARDTAGVGITEHRGDILPLDTVFTDTSGRDVKLGDYFHKGRPVILQLGYLSCPMICDVISKNIVDSVKNLDLSIGADYDVLYLSINPEDKWPLAQRKKQTYVDELNKPGATAGWNFLVGQEGNIKKVADAVGFNFRKIDGKNEFSHPPMIVILTADGKISRYFYGWSYPSNLLRTGLIEAGQGKVGGYVEQITIALCYHYDDYSGKYTLVWVNLMKIGGLLTVLILGAVLGRLWLRDWRAKPKTAAAQPVT